MRMMSSDQTEAASAWPFRGRPRVHIGGHITILNLEIYFSMFIVPSVPFTLLRVYLLCLYFDQPWILQPAAIFIAACWYFNYGSGLT